MFVIKAFILLLFMKYTNILKKNLNFDLVNII